MMDALQLRVLVTTLVFCIILLRFRGRSRGDAPPSLEITDVDLEHRRRAALGGTPISRWIVRLAGLRLVRRLGIAVEDRVPGVEQLHRVYSRAGWPGGLQPQELTGMTAAATLTVLTVVQVFALASAGTLKLEPAAISVLLVPSAITAWLTAAARKRSRQLDRMLPYTIDLLSLLFSAGVPIQQALRDASLAQRGNAMGVELRGVVVTMRQVGIERSMDHFTERVPGPVANALAGIVVQADRSGLEAREAVRMLANQGRQLRLQRAKQIAGRSKVAMGLPIVLALFSGLTIVFAPLIARYVEMGGVRGMMGQ